jgi:hypothetical protein
MRKMAIAATLLAVASTGGAQDPNVLNRAINNAGTAWSFYGANYKAKAVKSPGVPYDEAVQVRVSAKAKNAYETAAYSVTTKPVAAGTTLAIAVYLRAPAAAEGQTIPLPIQVSEANAPYAAIASDTAQVGPQWKLFYASGKPAKAYAAGEVRALVHLAGDKQLVELGPVFLVDLGPNFDTSKLK